MLEPRIETKPALRLIGMKGAFVSGLSKDTNAHQVIPELWGGFFPRMNEVPTTEHGVCYAWISFAPFEGRTRDDELEYLAGMAVAPDAEVPEGMAAMETAAGLYAVFEHVGPMDTFHDTLRQIYGEWFPRSEYVCSGKGDVEAYDERFDPSSADSICEYWVGIEKKA